MHTISPRRRQARTYVAAAAALVSITAGAAASLLAPADAAAASPTRVPRSVAAVDRVEFTEVRLINRLRRSRGLRPLRVDGRLTRAAGWMALDLGRTSRFSHTDSLGRDPFDRLRAFGYPSSDTWRGENLAAGNPAPLPTLQQWIGSPPHLRNMLDPRYRAIGIARVYVARSPYRWYWATTFGSRWTVRPS